MNVESFASITRQAWGIRKEMGEVFAKTLSVERILSASD